MKTNNNQTSFRQRARAFTLVEAIVALAVSSVAMIALVSLTMFTGRTFAALFNYVELDDSNRIAMDTISRDIRTAERVVSFSADEFTVESASGANLSYRYNAASRTLSRVATGGARVILRECERFNFTVCQRTPMGAMSEIYPAADVATAKVINLSWVCSRSLLGQRANTESVQTARIVIRKQGPII